MRAASILASLALAGCLAPATQSDPSPEVIAEASLAVIVDAARIAPDDASAQPWCPGSSALRTKVAMTLAGLRSETDLATGLTPKWNAELIEASAPDIVAGFSVELTGQCDDGAGFPMGALTIHPGAARVHDGQVLIARLATGVHVALHFETPSCRCTPGSTDGGDDVIIDDYPWTDDSGDGSTWIDDGGGTDDGGGGTIDDGGGGTDDGGGTIDDGGDDGSDDGSSDDGSSDGSETDSVVRYFHRRVQPMHD